jgi:DNA polymerase-4
LVDEMALQLELPLPLGDGGYRPGTTVAAALWAVDRAMDAVRLRFGREAVGYAGNVYSDVERVPEAFRELAEHRPR